MIDNVRLASLVCRGLEFRSSVVEEGIIAEGVKRESLLTNCAIIPERDE
jgi:hypothetical protein